MNVQDMGGRSKPDSTHYGRNCVQKLRKTIKASLKLEQLTRVSGWCHFGSGQSKGGVKNLWYNELYFLFSCNWDGEGWHVTTALFATCRGQIYKQLGVGMAIVFMHPALPHSKSTLRSSCTTVTACNKRICFYNAVYNTQACGTRLCMQYVTALPQQENMSRCTLNSGVMKENV
jgi:hypothetical protein